MARRARSLDADEVFDPLGHIDPRNRTFYRDSAAAAAYLIRGEGYQAESGRCVLTTAIMHQALQAVRENRTSSLLEIHSVLIEAGRKIRARARGGGR
jgi:hypothetical protein